MCVHVRVCVCVCGVCLLCSECLIPIAGVCHKDFDLAFRILSDIKIYGLFHYDEFCLKV